MTHTCGGATCTHVDAYVARRVFKLAGDGPMG